MHSWRLRIDGLWHHQNVKRQRDRNTERKAIIKNNSFESFSNQVPTTSHVCSSYKRLVKFVLVGLDQPIFYLRATTANHLVPSGPEEPLVKFMVKCTSYNSWMPNNRCYDKYLIEIALIYIANMWYISSAIWIWNQLINHFWIKRTSF